MGDPSLKASVSRKRKRNFIAKELKESKMFRKKIHYSAKDREKQRKWRLENDPEGDYVNLDNFLMGDD